MLDSNCLIIKNTQLKEGTGIVLLNDKNKIIKAKVSHKTLNSDECEPLVEDRKSVNISNGQTFYVLLANEDIAIGIGMTAKQWDDKIKELSFTHCSTSEGIQYNLYKFNTDEKKPQWTGYYYLGYDIEPDCIGN